MSRLHLEILDRFGILQCFFLGIGVVLFRLMTKLADQFLLKIFCLLFDKPFAGFHHSF